MSEPTRAGTTLCGDDTSVSRSCKVKTAAPGTLLALACFGRLPLFLPSITWRRIFLRSSWSFFLVPVSLTNCMRRAKASDKRWQGHRVVVKHPAGNEDQMTRKSGDGGRSECAGPNLALVGGTSANELRRATLATWQFQSLSQNPHHPATLLFLITFRCTCTREHLPTERCQQFQSEQYHHAANMNPQMYVSCLCLQSSGTID
jgi:hypothetical protein